MDVMPRVWGDEWELGCPKSPMWDGQGEAWSENGSVSSNGSRESNVGNNTLPSFGLCGLGDKISFFLKGWEWSLPHGPGHAEPGKA